VVPADGEVAATLETTKKPGGVTGKGFMPGRSGNQTGRPRGFTGLAAYIKERTNDGRRLVDFALEILDGKPIDMEMVLQSKEPGGRPSVIHCRQTPPPRLRLEAAQWLADRGWGKPIREVAVTPSRSFVVSHRLYKPGEDPLAASEGEVSMPPAAKALPARG
jgi:hypothetical protein